MKLLLKYFPNLTPEQLSAYEQLALNICHWNDKINLISRKDTEHLEERHILHSLAIACHLRFKSGSLIIDVGTGGGFPGLPLAIMFPNVHFTLVDSIRKKINVVKELTHTLELKNVSTRHVRAEKVSEKYDFVVSRAVTSFPKFLGWTKNLISEKSNNEIPNGILALKGGDLSDELAGSNKKTQIIPVSSFFDEKWFTTKHIVYWHPAKRS